jgi:hypothetical protein
MNERVKVKNKCDLSDQQAILFKAEYYLLRLSRVLYVNKANSTLFRLRECLNAFPELHGKTRSLSLRNQFQMMIGLLKCMPER